MTLTELREAKRPVLDGVSHQARVDYPATRPRPEAHGKQQDRLPNPTGLAALILAIAGVILAFLLLIGLVEWYTPLFMIAPAAATAISALALQHHKKVTAVAALALCAAALVPPAAALAQSDLAPGAEATPVIAGDNPFDALMRLVTQNSGGDTTGSTDTTTGTGGTDTGGTDTTPGNGSGDPVGGGADVETGVTLDAGEIVPTVVEKTSGVLGELLTTANGVAMRVTSAQCGLSLPLLSGLTGQLCAVQVDVANGSDHVVSVTSSSMTGISGSSSFLGNSALGLNPLSANVAPGASSSGTLYFSMPSSSSLDALRFQLGGEPASSAMTVSVN